MVVARWRILISVSYILLDHHASSIRIWRLAGSRAARISSKLDRSKKELDLSSTFSQQLNENFSSISLEGPQTYSVDLSIINQRNQAEMSTETENHSPQYEDGDQRGSCMCYAAVVSSISAFYKNYEERSYPSPSAIEDVNGGQSVAADLVGALAKQGLASITFVKGYAGSCFPKVIEMYKQIKAGNPIAVGIQQYSSKKASDVNHALIITGMRLEGAQWFIQLADPWGGLFSWMKFAKSKENKDAFPSTFDQVSQVKLPAGFFAWQVTKVVFTAPSASNTIWRESDSPMCKGGSRQ